MKNSLHSWHLHLNVRVQIATKLVITNERIISAHVKCNTLYTFDFCESYYCYLFLTLIQTVAQAKINKNEHINYAHYSVENVYVTR